MNHPINNYYFYTNYVDLNSPKINMWDVNNDQLIWCQQRFKCKHGSTTLKWIRPKPRFAPGYTRYGNAYAVSPLRFQRSGPPEQPRLYLEYIESVMAYGLRKIVLYVDGVAWRKNVWFGAEWVKMSVSVRSGLKNVRFGVEWEKIYALERSNFCI